MWTQHGHAAARLALAFALGSSTMWSVSPVTAQVPARVTRVRPDTGRDSSVVQVTISAAAMERLIRELIVSRELEQTIAMSLRDAATGQRTEPQRVRILSDSLRQIARRNAELTSRIEIQCPMMQPHPDGYLGVYFEAVQIDQRENEPAMFRLGSVQSVTPGSPAEKAGIRSGDRLVLIGGADASKPIALGNILKPGARVQVRLQRDGAAKDVIVQVEKRPDGFDADCLRMELLTTPDRDAPVRIFSSRVPSPGRMVARTGVVAAPEAPMPARVGGFGYTMFPTMPNVIAGASLMALDEDWRQALSVDNGVLVMKVAQGTPAKDAGLRASDVIVSADGESVASIGALRRVMSNAKSSALKLQVIRAQKTVTVTLRWQERER